MTTGVTAKSQASAGHEQAPGMRRGDTQDPERHGVWVVDGIISGKLGWFFREQFLMDYGIDAQAEVVADDDLVTGQLLALQIKGGNSWFSKPYDGGWSFYGNSNHLAYWLGHSLPVIVVIVDDDGNAFWEQVTPSTARETPQGFALKIPRSQPLDATARDKLLAVAGRSRGLAASLPDFYAVLPPTIIGTLERAAGTDRLAAARLAERLATGRAAPDATAALVIAGKPSWLMNSAAAQDLWLAVAGYAAEHARPRESGDAFTLAADSPGPRSARARALAGIQLIASDRDTARDLLRRARDEGETTVADVGLAAVALPRRRRPPGRHPGLAARRSAGRRQRRTVPAELPRRGGPAPPRVHRGRRPARAGGCRQR